MVVRIFRLIVLTALLRGAAFGQEAIPDSTPRPGPVRFGIATGVAGGFLLGSLVMSYNDWWKGSSTPFHFVQEGFLRDYSSGIDKFGHAYTSYLYFHTIRDLLAWGGYSSSQAFWLGATGAFTFGVLVEIGDGYSPFGFSWEDEAANLIGLGFGMLQVNSPILENFQFKWSYYPRGGLKWPPHFTDHYDWHTYWLAFNFHRLLPGSVGDWWPEWLQPAVGYGVDRGWTRREIVFGLDLNLGAFSTDNRELDLLKRISTRLHFPGPAVKFTGGESTKSYLLHFN
jgi:hypothetical protein